MRTSTKVLIAVAILAAGIVAWRLSSAGPELDGPASSASIRGASSDPARETGAGPAAPSPTPSPEAMPAVPLVEQEPPPPLSGSFRARDERDQVLITGRCVAEESGEPLEGCEVVLTGHLSTGYPLSLEHSDWTNPDSLATGSDGRFRFRIGLPDGEGTSYAYGSRVHLRIRRAGRVEAWGSLDFATLDIGKTTKLGDIPFARGAVRDFRVVNEHGDPVPECLVYVRRLEPEPIDAYSQARVGRSEHLYERTRGDGTIAPGKVFRPGFWAVEAPGREILDGPTCFEVGPALESASLQLTVKAPGRMAEMAGRVRNAAGSPVGDVQLGAIWNEPLGEGRSRTHSLQGTKTSRDGEFRFDVSSVPEGTSVIVEATLQASTPERVRLGSFQRGQTGLDLLLDAAAVVSVRVVDETGQPVHRFAARCLPDAPYNRPSGRVSGSFEDGRAEITGLLPGIHRVAVVPFDERFVSAERAGVDVPANGRVNLEFALEAAIPRRCEVRLEDGTPVAGSRVELLSGGKSAPEATEVVAGLRTQGSRTDERKLLDAGETDERGCATLRASASLRQAWLRALGPGHLPRVQTADTWTAGDEALVITVAAGGVVRGRVEPLDVVEALDGRVRSDRDATRLNQRSSRKDYRGGAEALAKQRRPRIYARDPSAPELRGGAKPFPLPRGYADQTSAIAADGSFEIRDLPPGVRQLHLVTYSGYDARPQPHEEILAEVTVDPRNPVERVLSIATFRPKGILGRALLDGEPLANGEVDLYEEAQGTKDERRDRRPFVAAALLRTDPAGALLSNAVAPMTYRAVLSKRSGKDAPRIPARELVVVAESSGPLELRFESAAIRGAEKDGLRTGPWTHWHANGRKHSEGAYDERGLRAGAWRFWKPDGAEDASLAGTYEAGRRVGP